MMTENGTMNRSVTTDSSEMQRSFLLVVDASEEMASALRFACRRAAHTNGTVALFHAVEPADFHHFASIGELMESEARSEAEDLLQRVASKAMHLTGKMPDLFLREGDTIEQLLALIDEEDTISVLVLGAGTNEEGPGPLVSALSGRLAGKIRLPVTIVPGSLTDDEINQLT